MGTQIGASSLTSDTVRAIPVPFLVLDVNREIVAASDAWETLTSQPVSDLIGQEGTHAFLPEAAATNTDISQHATIGRIQDSWQRCIASGQSETLSIDLSELHPRLGRATTCSVTTNPVVDEHGRVETIVCCLICSAADPQLVRKPPRRRPALTTRKPSTLSDLVVHHPQLQETIGNFDAIRRVDDLKQVALDPALSALQAYDIRIYLHERSASSLRLVSQKSQGLGVAWRQPLVSMTKALPVVEAATIGHPVVLASREAIESYSDDIGTYAKRSNAEALLAVPIFDHDTLIGVLAASFGCSLTSATNTLSACTALTVGLGPRLAHLIDTDDKLAGCRSAERRNAGGRFGLIAPPTQHPGLRVEVGVAGGNSDLVTNQWVDTIPISQTEYVGIMGCTDLPADSIGWSIGEVKDVLRGIIYGGVTDPASALAHLDAAFPQLQLTTPAAATVFRLLRRDEVWDATWCAAGSLWPIFHQQGSPPKQLTGPETLSLGLPEVTARHNNHLTLKLCDTLTLMSTSNNSSFPVELPQSPPTEGASCPNLLLHTDNLLQTSVALNGHAVRTAVLAVQVHEQPTP